MTSLISSVLGGSGFFVTGLPPQESKSIAVKGRMLYKCL
jgi:hypothetical protein